jgi:thioredoxin 1
VEELTPTDFEGDRLGRPGAFLVLFDASWCPFCRRFRPRFFARDGTFPATLAHADLSDESNPLWESFAIEVVPTLVAFQDGAPVHRWDGISMVGLDDAHLDRAAEFFRKARA